MPFAHIDENLKMYYDIDDFTDPWKTPETIVLHHGMAKNHRFWYAWVPLLACQFRVVRIDARGLGKSTIPPPGYSWSLSGFARDLRLLLEHLGVDKVHLIGETLGGAVAMEFAYEYPSRLHSLTTCGSPYLFPQPRFQESVRKVETDGVLSWAREGMAKRLDPSKVDPAFVDWYAAEMGKTSQRVASEVLRVVSGTDLSNILPQITVPTLLLSSEHGHVSSQEVQRMHRLLSGSKLVIFKGASGFVQHSEPKKCVDEFLAFVKGL